MKCKRTSDGRKLDHHSLRVMRQQAIKAIREGQAVKDNTPQQFKFEFGL